MGEWSRMLNPFSFCATWFHFSSPVVQKPLPDYTLVHHCWATIWERAGQSRCGWGLHFATWLLGIGCYSQPAQEGVKQSQEEQDQGPVGT